MQDIIVYALIGIAVIYMLKRYFHFRKKKEGNDSCCTSCKDCPLKKGCHKK